MRRSALRRAILVSALLVACAAALGRGPARNLTYALFNGETTNAGSAFANGWIGPATNVSATYSGNNVTLNWTVGTPLVNTQAVYGYDLGTSGTCAGNFDTSYLSIGSIANNTTATYTDTGRASGINGHYFCYELLGNNSTYTSWQSATTFEAQVGMVATGLSIQNVATSGAIANTDRIVLTWNQRTNLTATSAKVCVYTDGNILIGDTANGSQCNGSTDGYSIAKVTASGGTIGSAPKFASSTVTSTTTAPYTTTITLSGGSAATVSGTPTWTATPASTIASNTGAVGICTSRANCTPTTTSNF